MGTGIEADEKAREKYPDDVLYFNKIGGIKRCTHRNGDVFILGDRL